MGIELAGGGWPEWGRAAAAAADGDLSRLAN